MQEGQLAQVIPAGEAADGGGVTGTRLQKWVRGPSLLPTTDMPVRAMEARSPQVRSRFSGEALY